MTTRLRFSALIGALLFTRLYALGQELQLSPTNHFYECALVKPVPATATVEQVGARLRALNYKNVVAAGDTALMAEGFTNHLVGGFATVEIRYTTKLIFRQNRYRLVLTGFVLTDKNGSNPLEGMGAFKNRWVRIINEKLPAIVGQIEDFAKTDKW